MVKSSVVLIWVTMACSLALACTCGDPPPCAKVGRSPVVFIGIPLNDAHPWVGPAQILHFKVERSFKGLPDGTDTVDVESAAGTSCEAPFSRGTRYLVYAEHSANSQHSTISDFGVFERFRRFVYGQPSSSLILSTALCSGSKPVSQANEDLQFLKAWQSGATPTSIQGEVYPDAGQGNYASSNRLLRELRGSVVKATDDKGHSTSVSSDETGQFLISPVRPGSYTITVSKPRFRSFQPEYRASVPDRACAVINISMGLDGRVAGRMTEPDGHSPLPIKIQLMPVLGGDRYPMPLETVSLADGTYAFAGVPPGRYTLGVNIRDEPSEKIPYTRVSYPGVEVVERATVLELGEAKVILNLDFKVSRRLRPRTITAAISWPDGSPARFVHTWCAAVGYAPWRHELTDKDGRITFMAMDGLPYEIGAAAASDYEIASRRRFSAEPVHIFPGPSVSTRLTLSIPPKR